MSICPCIPIILQIFNNCCNLTKLTDQHTQWILHDWSDEECEESIPSKDEGRKVIIDHRHGHRKPNERQRNNGDTAML